MANLDGIIEAGLRGLARTASRRSALTKLGKLMVGAGVVPLLPVARATAQQATPPTGDVSGDPRDPGDRSSCDYWRYCAIDGFLCACCGGSPSQCPPGTEMAALTWIGTCTNPGDGRKYVISYNDCCGLTACFNCGCNRNEGDRPMVRPQSNNDYNWCVGSSSTVYHCSTAVIIGIATEAR